MYSQRDEEEVILKHLPQTTGRFCDIGAYGFLKFSNTRALAEKGWTGVLVEPCPESFVDLLKNVEGFKGLELVHALVTTGEEGLVKFWNSPNAVSSTDEEHVKIWAPHVPFVPIWAPAIPIGKLIQQFGPTFSFINIDTEGTSAELLQAIDLKAVGCELVCVEMDKHEAAIRAYFQAQGYAVIHKTAENLIAKRVA